MNAIAKVSDLAASDIAGYLRLPDPDTGDLTELSNYLSIAKAFITDYTGLSIDDIDNHEDMIPVVFLLCQDMYDNRSAYVDKGTINRAVEVILNMHSTNYLPEESDD